MKGRIFDPKVGRFLTTDPIVSAPLSGQSWNPYSYVANNPLNYVDPSGFDGLVREPGYPDADFRDVDHVTPGPQFQFARHVGGGQPPEPPPPDEPNEGEQVGAAVPPVDVSPTGNTATYDPQPITTAPDGSNGIAAVELSLGFGAGVATGLLPGGAVAEQIGTRVGLEQGWIEPHPDLQLGIALGQIFGGLVRVVQGGLLIKGGAALSATGVGAIAGVPAIGVGAAWAVAGAANIVAGVDGLQPGTVDRVGEHRLAGDDARCRGRRESTVEDRPCRLQGGKGGLLEGRGQKQSGKVQPRGCRENGERACSNRSGWTSDGASSCG
jgi:hypothetical protein